jgi:hypothetical protein
VELQNQGEVHDMQIGQAFDELATDKGCGLFYETTSR